MTLESGSQLGSYEILSLLGSGGMGEVYKAKDLKLGRTVAIKLLQKNLASDPERLKRFEQEAKAASALDHPNIVTIHDIAEVEGKHFIVMQYVEGKTLRELMGKLKLSQALHYAIQISDGLALAHSHGIVHRDLKPDNIMVTEDGLVKILDFGLAKLIEPSDWTEASTKDLAQPHTKEGHIVGTAPYMSPEQAQGQKVDARSDIFSFGSVLYEMVTGRRAFSEGSVPELLTAIIRDEPQKVSDIVPSVPLELERSIARALRKDSGRRFQSIADMRVELLEIKEDVDSGSSIRAEDVTRVGAQRRQQTWLWLAAGLAILALGTAGWLYFSPSAPDRPPPRTIPLTSYPGAEHEPAISPDGNQVAFTRSGESGTRDLYLKLIDGGEPLLISQGTGSTYTPTWSPDGQQIAFVRDMEGEGREVSRGIFVISALGGAERQITTSRAGYGYGLSWSPDGKLLAMVDRVSAEEPDSLFLLSLETGDRRRLATPPVGITGDEQPRFSPDGQTVSFVRQHTEGQSDIYVVPADGGEPRRLTIDNRYTSGLDWTPDGRSIVFGATRPGRAGFWSLWRVSVSGGEPEPLDIGDQGVNPSFSRKGDRLVYVKADYNWDIWRVGGPAAQEDDKSPIRFISSTGWDFMPHYSPDGQKISFTSNRSGYHEIWISENDGSNPRQLTFLEDPHTMDGNWSPDGQQIAFMSPKEGSRDIYVVNVTGGFPRRLTIEASSETYPRWSRDGRHIYFYSDRAGRAELYRIPADGGDAIQLTTNGGGVASESPDGRFIYLTKSGPLGGLEGPPGIWRIPADGDEEVQVHDRGEYTLWEVMEEGIYYVNRDSAPPAIELLDLATGEVSQTFALDKKPAFYGLSVSPDRRWILYIQAENELDIILVENFH